MINKPVLTEKSFLDAGHGVFTFNVQPGMTKSEVKASVETLFKVHVTKMTSVIRKNRDLHTGKRRLSTSVAPTKSVRVWLKKGESISLFDIKKD